MDRKSNDEGEPVKNILLSLAAEKAFNSKIIKKIRELTEPDSVYIIVSDKKELSRYKDLGTCILRERTAQGLCRVEELGEGDYRALDDTVFAWMNPHSLEIMNQQRRFEEYHAFHIDPSFDSHYRIYMHNLYFWYNFLLTKEITHIFLSCVPHEGYDCIIYYLAKMLNIPVQMVYNSTFPFREYPLSDCLNVEEYLADEYRILTEIYQDTEAEDIPLEGDGERMYRKWSSADPAQMTPWYAKGNPLKTRFKTRFGETNAWKSMKTYVRPAKKKYGVSFLFFMYCLFHVFGIIGAAFGALRRYCYGRPVWKRTLKLNKYYNRLAEEPVSGEKYIYFALHYQPEASSNPLGGDVYVDQMFAINLLSKNFPEDVYIYVKVHQEQLAPLRSREYYQDMKRIPRVRLIKAGCSTYDLMQNALAVSTLTGTACWEAQFYQKPALLFGYSQKNLAPLTYHVRTEGDVREAAQRILYNPKTATEKELKLFSKAMFNVSYAVSERDEVLPEIIAQFIKGQPIIIKRKEKQQEEEA